MKEQGYNSRMDESLGMRRGKESSMSQGYKDRRDESKGMTKDMKGIMGHASMPKKVAMPKADGMGKVDMYRTDRGYSKEAY